MTEKIQYPLTPLILSTLEAVLGEVRPRSWCKSVFRKYHHDPLEFSEEIWNVGQRFLELYPGQFNLKFIPVTPAEFLLSQAYLNKSEEVYPKLIPYFMEMNSGLYQEALLTGAIGTAKTTLATWTNAYQLYFISAYENPQRQFNLESASEILFVFQSLNKQLAKQVDFARFKATIEGCPYFTNKFPFNKDLLSELVFPNRIIVRPISGESTGAIGQNVFGGLLDEVNYMEVTEESKRSVDKGEYNQAIELYNSLARRRKSRFMQQGRVPGVFCIVSSKRYPGQFTDQKEEESKAELAETGRTSIFVYDKRTWDVLPSDRFSGKWFDVFIGDESRKPKIIEEGDQISPEDQHLILRVPMEYYREFDREIMNALREIGGISTLALHPFFQSREDVADMFGHFESILSDHETDFVYPKLQIFTSRFFKPDLPRWVHIDLSLSHDSTGVSCGTVPGFAAITRGEDDRAEELEYMPIVRFDFQLRVKPPKGGEILYHKIRTLIYTLREAGLNIRWVSLDSYQSTDMMQILRQNNFITGELSMDTSTLPYEMLKSGCYDHRIQAPTHDLCEKELIQLERDPKKDKVDHPPQGSKDVADSMAGVVAGLTMRREVWHMYDVPINRAPTTLQEKMEKQKDKMRSKLMTKEDKDMIKAVHGDDV
jgi:hypothetical protein